MFNFHQSKNIINTVLIISLSVLLGEGVMGLGFFWPFLLILLDWRWIYWLSISVGVLISAIYRLPVGLPSLFLVVVTGGLSFVIGKEREAGWIILIVALIANFVFDKVFGFSWNIWDVVSVVVAWLVAVRWFDRAETIKINY